VARVFEAIGTRVKPTRTLLIDVLARRHGAAPALIGN
jgi:hypothetical protein